MARIAGVDIPNEKRIVTSLTYIYGIGDTRAQNICDKCGIDPQTKTAALTEDQARLIRNLIEKDYQVEGALRSEVGMNVQRLKDIGCYRGLRHRPQPAGAGSEYQEQCPHAEGPQGPSRRQEEVVRAANGKNQSPVSNQEERWLQHPRRARAARSRRRRRRVAWRTSSRASTIR